MSKGINVPTGQNIFSLTADIFVFCAQPFLQTLAGKKVRQERTPAAQKIENSALPGNGYSNIWDIGQLMIHPVLRTSSSMSSGVSKSLM